jgi:hypothetical protein
LLRGQATLFASKNHQALEAVLPRLNSAVEGGDLIIQTSSRDLAQRQNYLAKLQSLLARPPRPDSAQGEEYRRQFAALFSQQRAALSDISTLEQTRKEYEVLNSQLEESRTTLPLPAQSDGALANWPREITRESGCAGLQVVCRTRSLPQTAKRSQTCAPVFRIGEPAVSPRN